ncbi:hypothetical protein GCM10027174_16790 [Salinifilum aidingensis]
MRRWIGPAVLAALLALCSTAGMLRDPWRTRMGAVLQPPSARFPLGTDELGRDVLARLAHGAPATLGTAVAALVVSAAVGVLVGCATGWSSGRGARVVRAVVDVAVALPPLLVALVASLVAGPGRGTLLLALVGVAWLPFARHTDALTTALRSEPWVAAHRAVGAGTGRIWWRSILPRVVPASAELAVLRLPALVNTVAALGFIGLGPPPPSPEWGAMLAESVNHLGTAPWLLLVPVVALVLVQVLLAGLAGRGGAAAAGPHLRRSARPEIAA